MIKKVWLILLFFCCVFSVGMWKGSFEKRWVINTSENSTDLNLKGVFVAETQFQNITAVETSVATSIKKENGNYYVVYERQHPERESLVYAKANVFSYYAPHIKKDPPLTGQPILSENEKTMYNELIKKKADELKKETVLETIVALNDFVHEYVKYNESAEENSAIEVYANRQGACIEYVHLLMAMLNAVGIENRMVYGYVYSEKWVPHVWVEAYVPGYGWIDVDPAHGQVGFLNGRRVAMNINTRKDVIYDSVMFRDGEVDFEYFIYVTPTHQEEFDLVDIKISYSWPYFIVTVENKNDFYVFGRYEIDLPENISSSEKKSIILKPHETVVFKYPINQEKIMEGYLYLANVRVKFVDDVEEKEFEIKKPAFVIEKHEGKKGWWEIIVEIIERMMKLFGLYSRS